MSNRIEIKNRNEFHIIRQLLTLKTKDRIKLEHFTVYRGILLGEMTLAF